MEHRHPRRRGLLRQSRGRRARYLAALGAAFRLASVRGERLVPAERFFRGAFETDRAPDEMLTAMVLPAQAPGRHAYLKLKHAASSWPILTASCLAAEGGVRLCLGAAAPVPLLLEWPASAPPDPAHIETMAAEAAAAITTEWADELAGPGYRRTVAGTIAARALRRFRGRDHERNRSSCAAASTAPPSSARSTRACCWWSSSATCSG